MVRIQAHSIAYRRTGSHAGAQVRIQAHSIAYRRTGSHTGAQIAHRRIGSCTGA